MDYFTRIEAIEDALHQFDTALALRFVLGYHGYQLFDDGFYQYLVDEGILEEEEEEEEEAE